MTLRQKPRVREARIAFEALSIDGALLPADALARVAQLKADSQDPSDYRVLKGLNLRDEIGRYWRIAQAHWSDLTVGLAGGADRGHLAERFVLSLLRDAFGFGSLARAEAVTLAGRSYAIGFAALGGHVPVVIAPAGSGLDTLAPAFGDGGRRRSAFGLTQEYLNAEDRSLWGVASDGYTLRLVRDNASLTRPAWIEADLQRIFTEERYADFAALWLLAHESRFGRADQPPAECVLETWRLKGIKAGTVARDKLRYGVKDALQALGQGFLAHPDNTALRLALQGGGLTLDAYFNQLLRLVYRLIFLLTVEERELLHPDGADPQACALYAEGYAIGRLRDRAVKRSAHDRHGDQWDATRVVFRGVAAGEPRLGLPALAGLFAPSQCAAIDAARIENRWLLLAVFKLAWMRESSGLTRVNWHDMGPEELGSVYESLLQLVSRITQGGRQFGFAPEPESKGSDRKKTGSYYTPEGMVQLLLDSALEPVVQKTLARHPEQPAEALLRLAVVDPACGSGHFLLGAAHRLAAHVARLQAGGTASLAEYRRALRQVVGRCLYGVDLNPLAVELCKVTLWIEAMEPGRPLTFLDSHIQWGNALLGATPELMEKGIPDAAWEPIEGDDRKVASKLKKRNKLYSVDEQLAWSYVKPGLAKEAQGVQAAMAELDAASDASVEALAKKESQWSSILGSEGFRHQAFLANTWCAAFVWPKEDGALTDAAPTSDLWRQIREGLQQPPALTTETVDALAEQYHFFHWHLQFPQVFARGGFDVVLGNPPWERVKLQEQEFFASRSDDITNAPNAAVRKRLIAQLPTTNQRLWDEWCAASRVSQGESHFLRQSGRYPLCGKGDINTYAVFAEHNRSILTAQGRAGFIVPPGLATDDTTKAYFQELIATNALIALHEFENEEFIFPGIDHRVHFIAITVARQKQDDALAGISFGNRSERSVSDASRRFSLSPADFALLNPNTGTSPTFRSRRDADINLALYRRAGVLWRENDPDGNPWGLRFMRMLDMATDAALFRTQSELEAARWTRDGNRYVLDKMRLLPLIEAKMVQHFDHRFGTYEGQTPAQAKQGKLPELDDAAHADPHRITLPRYWVGDTAVESRLDDRWQRGWLLGWRDICRSGDQRTVIASLIPRVAVGHKLPLMFPDREPRLVAMLYANLTSFIFDYTARQKVGGTSLTYFILRQLPVLTPRVYAAAAPWSPGTSVRDWLLPRVLELTYTAWDLEAFARDCSYEGPPFAWDPMRREALRAELDAVFFLLYDLARDDADYILDTFPVVKKNDEREHGEFRTKRLILERYDALVAATRLGRPYRSELPEPRVTP